MPRNVSALLGAETSDLQIPVSLIYLDIPSPWGPLAIHDTDVDLYLNVETGAVSAVPVAGMTKFSAWADLVAPQLEQSNQRSLPSVELEMANVDQYWYGAVAAGTYRSAPMTMWQGNLAVGAAPDSITFIGAIAMYSGVIANVVADAEKVRLSVEPDLAPQAMRWPSQKYDSSEYKFMPKPGSKLFFGHTVKEL